MYGHPDAGYMGIGAVGGVPVGAVGYPESSGRPEQGSQGESAGTVPQCEEVTVGSYGARPREARTTGYYGYTGVPSDIVRTDQALVDGRAGWAGQAAAAGYCGPSGRAAQTAPDGRRAGVDVARVASSDVDFASRTPSVWAGVEPVKLYPDAGQPIWNSGIAGIPHSAYPGQPIQLRPAASKPYMSGNTHLSLVVDPGVGTATAPILNRLVELWVRAPPGQLLGAPPNATAQGWEVGPGNVATSRTVRSDSRQPVERTVGESSVHDIGSSGWTRTSNA